MKVGTDGALLGAWVDCEKCTNILDIGTGTGIIALMLAQRNPHATITAIEPNAGAFADAKDNIAKSPFSARIQLINCSLADFKSDEEFDLIVCNPPFFQADLHAPEMGRNMARHAIDLGPQELMACMKWLKAGGNISGVYPVSVFETVRAFAQINGMHPARLCEVKPKPEKAAHRILFSFVNVKPYKPITENLTIEVGGRHQYSNDFKVLLKDFYLNL